MTRQAGPYCHTASNSRQRKLAVALRLGRAV